MNDFIKTKRRVILSTDMNTNYCFLLPITSYLWSEIIDYYPMIFTCGKSNKYLDFVTSFIEKLGYEIFHINSINGYTDQNVAQISRLFVSCCPVSPDTYILTGDADMWPISKNYFYQQQSNKDFHIFGANISNHSKYSMCYLGAKASVWRNIININTNISIEQNIENKLDSFLGKNPSSDDGWYFDEKFFTMMLKKWDGYPYKCQMINREIHPGNLSGRLDRSNWNFNGNINGLIDSHLLHSGSEEKNWERIVYLLKCILPQNKFDIFIQYKKEWDSL